MTEIDMLSYLLVFALCVVFSSFTVDRKSAQFSFLSMICWFTLAICHIGLAYQSMFVSLSYLFMGLGFMFMIYGFALIFSVFQDRKRAQEWELV